MTIPQVDTFEHDIASEIKQKEASIVSIATASGDIQDTPLPPSPTSPAILIASILFFISIVTVAVLGYMYYRKSTTPVMPIVSVDTTPPANLSDISPILTEAIGTFVATTTKTDYGYAVILESYSPVFAYMIKNEAEYAEELATSLGVMRDTSTTTLPFIFTDITSNNQNIRVGTSGSSTIMYAFIGTNALVFATTTEAIIALRSSVLIR